MGSSWMEGLGNADCCHNPALAGCLEILGNDNGKKFGLKLISYRANSRKLMAGLREGGRDPCEDTKQYFIISLSSASLGDADGTPN